MDGDYEVDSLGGLLAVATANAHNIEVRDFEEEGVEGCRGNADSREAWLG